MSAVTPPRVAIVISHPIQHFCPQYASLAARSDYHTRVFFASAAGTTAYLDPQFGVEVRWEGLQLDSFPHEFLSNQNLPVDARLDAVRLGERLATYAPQAVLVYGYYQKLARRARRWAMDHDAKLLMFSDSELRHRRRLFVRAAKAAWLPHYLRSFDVFLTAGDANEEYLGSYGVPAERLVRAPYPIDREHYARALQHAAAERRRTRAELGIAEGRTVCTVVGKFVPWKRQRDAIAMLAAPGLEEVMLLLVGTGPDEAELRRLAGRVAAARVIFAGFVPAQDLPRYYAATDIYVQPSVIDAHPVAVSEAVFMGCPVVISDRCGSYGPTDDVQPGRNGFVYPCGDTSALADAVRRFAAAPALRSRFADASRAIGEQQQALSHGAGLQHALTALGLLP